MLQKVCSVSDPHETDILDHGLKTMAERVYAKSHYLHVSISFAVSLMLPSKP